MALNIVLVLRAAQALLALIVLGLSGYVVNWFRKHTFSEESPDEVNFLLFDGIWTLFLAVPYLVLSPIYFPAAAHKYALIAVDAVTMIFWFAGFIALAAELPSPKLCTGHVCDSMQAVTVFGAFEWLLFVATTVLVVLPIVRNRGSGGIKGPATTEVQAGV